MIVRFLAGWSSCCHSYAQAESLTLMTGYARAESLTLMTGYARAESLTLMTGYARAESLTLMTGYASRHSQFRYCPFIKNPSVLHASKSATRCVIESYHRTDHLLVISISTVCRNVNYPSVVFDTCFRTVVQQS
jgi:hypothetical protein